MRQALPAIIVAALLTATPPPSLSMSLPQELGALPALAVMYILQRPLQSVWPCLQA